MPRRKSISPSDTQEPEEILAKLRRTRAKIATDRNGLNDVLRILDGLIAQLDRLLQQTKDTTTPVLAVGSVQNAIAALTEIASRMMAQPGPVEKPRTRTLPTRVASQRPKAQQKVSVEQPKRSKQQHRRGIHWLASNILKTLTTGEPAPSTLLEAVEIAYPYGGRQSFSRLGTNGKSEQTTAAADLNHEKSMVRITLGNAAELLKEVYSSPDTMRELAPPTQQLFGLLMQKYPVWQDLENIFQSWGVLPTD